MIGKTILVGLRPLEPAGLRLEQFQGRVMSVEREHGIELCLAGQRSREVILTPPDLRAIVAAAPGRYRPRATGEVVENPDFTATWDIHPPTQRRGANLPDGPPFKPPEP